MIGTPIAFGLTMIVCFTLFYYYWRIRQLRARLLSAQTTPVPDLEFPIEFGIGKNVVETFPTIKACELKSTASEDLQCPICLVEYEEWEVLRQLPFCGHIFHTLCVGAWFEKQTTCPVCRMSMSELAEPFGESLVAESIQMHCRRNSPPEVAVEVVSDSSTPSWMVLNRRLPLPAPPVPDVVTLTTSEPDTTQAKAAIDEVQDDQTCSPDFHVVNVPQEEWTHTCSKCRSTTKPTKAVLSEDPETQQQSEELILILQASDQSTEELAEERLTSEAAFSSDEITAGNSGRCDDPSLASSANVKAQEDMQMPGSFEFQPILTKDVGLTFQATTP